MLLSISTLVCIKLTINPRLAIIDGNSMNPTLEDGEYVLTLGSRLTYSPKSGDIVVIRGDFEGENFDGKAIIKRVIATSGQTVRIEFEENSTVGARVYVDGLLMKTYEGSPNYTGDYSALAQYEYNYLGYYPDGTVRENYSEYYDYENKVYEITVPEGKIFFLGDNIFHSVDSRLPEIGCAPQKFIIGKAIIRVFPFSKFGSMYE